MLKLITKLIEFAERYSKNKAIYRKLLTDIDEYIFEATGDVTLRKWRYFAIDKNWFDKARGRDDK